MPTELALDDLFAEFHANCPEVYVELVALARKWKQRGFGRAGIGLFFEVLRWERLLAGVGDDRFKVNNSYRSRYAREIMRREPDLAGLFIVRELKT